MTLDMTAFAAALKQYYMDDVVENLVYQDNPLLAMMPKDEKFGGQNMPVPLIYGNPQGRSATFSVAQSGSTSFSSKLAQFLMTRVQDYSIATVGNEAIEASKGDDYAFMEAATTEIDGCINTLKRSIATSQYHSGFGEIGQIGSISGSTVTLLNIDDVTNVEVNQVHVFSASLSASGLRNSGATTTLTVTKVDRVAGVITYSAALSTVVGAAANDYIFCSGDRQDSSTPARLKLAGLEAWAPAAAPTTGDSFFTVDRSVDPTRLGGVRYNGAGYPVEEVLIEGATRVAREGFAVTHAFMNFRTYGNLLKALGAKVQYIDAKVGNVGFSGVTVDGPRGRIEVYADQNCPSNRTWALTLRLWKMRSLGKLVRVIESDGLQMLRQASADGIEIRYGSYNNMSTSAPGAHCNVQV